MAFITLVVSYTWVNFSSSSTSYVWYAYEFVFYNCKSRTSIKLSIHDEMMAFITLVVSYTWVNFSSSSTSYVWYAYEFVFYNCKSRTSIKLSIHDEMMAFITLVFTRLINPTHTSHILHKLQIIIVIYPMYTCS